MTITKDTIIGDILNIAPETAPLFMNIGMHCLGCPASRGETVEQACMVHGVDVDELLAAVNQMIADAQEQLEQADEADKAAFEEMIEQYKSSREDFLKSGAWEASEESIARYRTFAESIRVVRNMGLGDDNSEEFYDLMSQYMDQKITADEFITGVDRKLQMMMKEGM